MRRQDNFFQPITNTVLPFSPFELSVNKSLPFLLRRATFTCFSFSTNQNERLLEEANQRQESVNFSPTENVLHLFLWNQSEQSIIQNSQSTTRVCRSFVKSEIGISLGSIQPMTWQSLKFEYRAGLNNQSMSRQLSLPALPDAPS